MLYKIIINDRWFVYFDADVRIDHIGEIQNLVNWKRIVLKKSPLELAETAGGVKSNGYAFLTQICQMNTGDWKLIPL